MLSVSKDRWMRFGSIIRDSMDWIYLGAETGVLEDAGGLTAWYSRNCQVILSMRQDWTFV